MSENVNNMTAQQNGENVRVVYMREPFSFRKMVENNPNRLRGVLVACVALLAILVFLFMPVFIVGDKRTTGSVYLFDLIDMLGRSGNFVYYISAMDAYSNKIVVPGIVCWFIISTFALWVALLAVSLVCVFGGMKKHGKLITSVYCILFAIFQAVLFIVMITSSDLACRNIDGTRTSFYLEFSQTAVYVLSVFLAILGLGCSQIVKKNNLRHLFKYGFLYLLLVIPAVLVLVYNIYPMLLSLILSFKEYSVGTVWRMPWVGIDNFSRIFTDSTIGTAVLNTIIISVCRMVLGIIPPLFLAIMLFDMGFKKLKKSIQMIIYIPHFFSWVIIYNVAYAFINKEGLLSGIFGEINILHNNSAFLPLLLITDLWKECGWSTILYMAALTSVDTTLFEAAAIDGAGPIKRLFKITIPCIMPTIVFTTVMAVGNLLKGAGYEQIMLFGAENMKMANVIDTWVIWNGLNNFEYGLGSAVSLVQALIGLLMVVFCNKLSKKWVGVGLY